MKREYLEKITSAAYCDSRTVQVNLYADDNKYFNIKNRKIKKPRPQFCTVRYDNEKSKAQTHN